MKNRSETARRIDNYRKRNTSASSFQVFHNNSPEAALKEQIKAEEEKKKMDINQLYKSVMDKPPMFLKLKLELVDDEKADLSALRMYGKAENGFTREILECVSKCKSARIMQEGYGYKPDGRRQGSAKQVYQSEWQPFGTP